MVQNQQYQQPPVNNQPQAQQLQQQYAASAPPTTHKPVSVTTGVMIILAPYFLMVASIFLYALFNFILASILPEPTPAPGRLIAESSLMERIVNIVLFLMGALSIIAIIPCLVVGIILLARR